jgi:transposase
MKKIDLRSFSPEAKEHLRVKAVLAINEDGQSPETIVEAWGLTCGSVYEWLRRYDDDGLDGLKTVKNKGREPTLSVDERKILSNSICKYTPEHFGLGVLLWTREMFCACI